jgi:metal-dependent HD superfamily phosphatase/phosphodiesterase
VGLITLEAVKKNEWVKAYITSADDYLASIGYTEHGRRHCGLVANIAYNILSRLGIPEREAELSAIAGYLHDIGNAFNRKNHPFTGAVLAHTLLRDMGMPPDEVTQVCAAIGNHDENGGEAISRIAAGLILGDKSDVHRSRVRNPDMIKFDIHDRVNYAVENSFLRVDPEKRTITLELTIDTEISSVVEYFEIFLSRMVLCRRAASFLECEFNLVINQTRLL